ncbi:GNAT family N-acetyltransferase [Pseudanabaena sp. 'Roaring Creek']|uniref:GNAT family N-acetyltransferase n=1 Tax=Pseudanabaena sp. 'Roaring Creek' TaxID=1681830 RepID=UPI0006D7F2BD|nr:GNAT family N-acetyltransferase [Pseudanabaena sp. 'Roaring Creek']
MNITSESFHQWRIVPIQKQYQRDGFDCGYPSLNDYIKKYARQNDQKGIAKAFVALPDESNKIAGYYTLSSCAIAYSELPDRDRAKLPSYPIPAVLIGRLAVDRIWQGQGLGSRLLVDALMRALRISQEVGVYAVRVDALDVKAKEFYLRHEFLPFQDVELSLFLPIATIARVFKELE